MNFQYSILILAIILVIVGSIILSYSIKSSIKSKKWPSYISNCPDYWLDTTGDGTACKSNLVNVSTGTGCYGDQVNFSGKSLCEKYKISNECGIYWDGINYGNPKVAKDCANK